MTLIYQAETPTERFSAYGSGKSVRLVSEDLRGETQFSLYVQKSDLAGLVRAMQANDWLERVEAML